MGRILYQLYCFSLVHPACKERQSGRLELVNFAVGLLDCCPRQVKFLRVNFFHRVTLRDESLGLVRISIGIVHHSDSLDEGRFLCTPSSLEN